MLFRLLSVLLLAVVSVASAATDAAIEEQLRTRLGRSKIAADHFQYKVRGGVVTWTGKTDVIQHKGAATRMAKSSGAARVDNQIQISDSAKQRASANLEKGRRREQVSRSEAPMKRSEVKR